MPFFNSIRSIGPVGAGRRVKAGFFKCLVNPGIVTLNPADNKCYYPADYAATATQTPYQALGCWNGGDPYWSPGQCCSCSPGPAGSIGCFGTGCQCYSSGWVFLGNSSSSCYSAYYTTQYQTTYSCPVNSGIATVSGSNCVYPAAYNATFS